MTDDLKLAERLRERAVFAREEKTATAICDARHFEEAASAVERLVRERDEARNSLIQARNERDEDRQRRRDLHARHAVEITALRADRDRLAKLVAEMREGLADAAAHLAGAASAYRAHASRHRSVGRATSDPFFTTRVGDFDRAAERARALLTRTQEQVG